MNLLQVGDIHLKRQNLQESKTLFERILSQAKSHDLVVLFGDFYNDHGVLHAEVLEAGNSFFRDLSAVGISVVVIEGNHDEDGSGRFSSLCAHSQFYPNITWIMKPKVISFEFGSVLFMPFIRDPREFESEFIKNMSANPLLKYCFCHQEFSGAQYENGMYAPNGADAKALAAQYPEVQFVSGHIHKEQKFGNVWYLGAPRWLSKSDANQPRGIWSMTAANNSIKPKEFISSEDISPAYHSISVTDDTSDLPSFKESDKVYIEYSGDSKKRIQEIESKYPNRFIKQNRPSISAPSSVSESKGVNDSLLAFITGYDTSFDKDILFKEISVRLNHG